MDLTDIAHEISAMLEGATPGDHETLNRLLGIHTDERFRRFCIDYTAALAEDYGLPPEGITRVLPNLILLGFLTGRAHEKM